MRHRAPHSLLLTYKGSGTPPPVDAVDTFDAKAVTKLQPASVGPAASTQSLSGAHNAGAQRMPWAAQPPYAKIDLRAGGGRHSRSGTKAVAFGPSGAPTNSTTLDRFSMITFGETDGN